MYIYLYNKIELSDQQNESAAIRAPENIVLKNNTAIKTHIEHGTKINSQLSPTKNTIYDIT